MIKFIEKMPESQRDAHEDLNAERYCEYSEADTTSTMQYGRAK